MMSQHLTQNHHAVVIGGSFAGLLAARVLSDHFETITIIERDRLPESSDVRAGVPQGMHGHSLMLRGRQIVSELLPGIEEDLLAEGVVVVDQGGDAMLRFKGGWAQRIDSGLKVFSMSRGLLEWHVRRHVLRNPRITIRQGYDVLGLQTDGKAINAVDIRQRGTGAAETLNADLVIDASGRGSRMPEWLVALGYDVPEETQIDAFVGYSTQWFEVPEDASRDWKAMWVQSIWPTMPRGGLILPIEGNVWQVTLFGVAKDYPPTDDAGFLEYARTLASNRLYHAIKNAKRVSPVYGFRSTVNRLRHYDKLARFPERLVVIGDAYCAFNPTYAQGMTTSSLGAKTLMECLNEQNGNLDGLGQKFQKRLAKVVAPAWEMTTTEDARWETTTGVTRDAKTRFIHWYTDKVMTIIPHDVEVLKAFLPVQHMLKLPTSLMAPAIMRKVLAYAIRQRLQGKKPQPITVTQEIKTVGAGD